MLSLNPIMYFGSRGQLHNVSLIISQFRMEVPDFRTTFVKNEVVTSDPYFYVKSATNALEIWTTCNHVATGSPRF